MAEQKRRVLKAHTKALKQLQRRRRKEVPLATEQQKKEILFNE